jgi:geranylgeranyl diphosphate synthase type II
MLKQYCRERVALIDRELDKLIPAEDKYNSTINAAMRYSIFAGGKRLRPILLMAAADAVGADGSDFLRVACGLEMIHTYSLIHDDLPAMDDDDFRRGKPTNHKVFGEGIAILAGDGLLTAAFTVMLSQKVQDSTALLTVIQEIAQAAGPEGMVGGQAIDLRSEGKTIDKGTLEFMHRSKTGALFKAAIRTGARLAGASSHQLACLTEYAEQFGLAFQITDDILDVTGTAEKIGKPVGSDLKNDKVTYVSLYSLDGARQLAETAVNKAIAALEDFGDEASILRELVKQLIKRDN